MILQAILGRFCRVHEPISSALFYKNPSWFWFLQQCFFRGISSHVFMFFFVYDFKFEFGSPTLTIMPCREKRKRYSSTSQLRKCLN